MAKPSVDRVLALLDVHLPTGAREAGSLLRIRELLAASAAPFSRSHYAPGHLTASAIVVDPERRRTLLVFHAKLCRWLQPGGHFEPGETDPSVASAREVLEETRLDTRPPGALPRLLDVDVHAIPARGSEPEHFHFDLRMLLWAGAGPVGAGDPGVTRARWFTPAEWGSLNLDPGLLRALGKVAWSPGGPRSMWPKGGGIG